MIKALQQQPAALNQLLRHYQSILQAVGEGIISLDSQGMVTFANNSAAKILGYEPSDLIGQDFHQLLHYGKVDGDLLPREDCQICAVLRDGKIHSANNEVFWSKEGSNFPVDYLASPIIENEQIVGAVIAFRDISDRKELEAQLIQAQKMESVGRLAGGVAHDFNNILSVIMGNAEMALEGLNQDTPIFRWIAEIKKAAERASALTRKLLVFSRKQILEPQVLNLNSVVNDTEDMLRRLIGEDIELVTVLDPSLGNITADLGQLEQVIMNLAVNARDAMSERGKLTIATANAALDEAYAQKHQEVEPGNYVILEISDNGNGMTAETQAHIFEPFFTTKMKGKGTGLGLSTVHGIVKQSGGHIWVSSAPGKGTIFKIFFPRVDKALVYCAEEAAPYDSPQGTETILVVEDDRMLRELACEILGNYGYDVLEARNGDEALLICEQHKGPVHLMLTDLVMPGMTGRELADCLMSMLPELKVLHMSGYTENALEPTAHFIQKPFSVIELAYKVREVLNPSQNG